MKRRDFLKVCQALGLSAPFISANAAQNPNAIKKEILIIGAGPAGLTAAYLLEQLGLPFSIVEAQSLAGGRIRHTREFTDFPLSLGGEWIHVKPDILSEIVNDESIAIDIETTRYKPINTTVYHNAREISLRQAGFTHDSKFINSSWLDFFERYIVPSLVGHIDYECVVESIDYSNKEINVQTSKGIKRADKVILTAPVKTLQQGAIEFRPPLPKSKQKAIDKVRVWDGCKAFIQFTNAFYPTLYSIGIKPSSAGQKLFYDAAYGQRSSQNVLGLFAVGVAAHQYQSFDDESRIDFLLSELDELFDGQASPNYVKHVFQNWTAEPYARGAYVLDYENWRRVRTLGRSVGGRLFFAGDAYTTGEDWSSVHAAARSAQRAVQEILTLGN